MAGRALFGGAEDEAARQPAVVTRLDVVSGIYSTSQLLRLRDSQRVSALDTSKRVGRGSYG